MEAANISVMILTYNEEDNIRRCLSSLSWAKNILVVDSFSNDRTLTICSEFPNVNVKQRAFTTLADQCNFGLSQLESEWVLSLDADYLLSTELTQEILALTPGDSDLCYCAPFVYFVHAKPLRKTLLPPRSILYRRTCASYINDGHAHKVQVASKANLLRNAIYHDDRKPLARWLQAQIGYAELEADKLTSTPKQELSLADTIRSKIVIAPVLVFFYSYLIQGLVLDGWRGYFYCAQRAFAELLLSLQLLQRTKFPR